MLHFAPSQQLELHPFSPFWSAAPFLISFPPFLPLYLVDSDLRCALSSVRAESLMYGSPVWSDWSYPKLFLGRLPGLSRNSSDETSSFSSTISMIVLDWALILFFDTALSVRRMLYLRPLDMGSSSLSPSPSSSLTKLPSIYISIIVCILRLLLLRLLAFFTTWCCDSLSLLYSYLNLS